MSISENGSATGHRSIRWWVVAALLGGALVAVAISGVVVSNTEPVRERDDRRVHFVDQPLTPVPPKYGAEPERRTDPNLRAASVDIPAVGISSRLISLGLNADHTLEVPADYSVAGWYIHRAVPGEIGPSVIAGHVDSKSGPGVFFRLHELRRGDTVNVARSDHSIAVFTVAANEQYDKDAFPTQRVYGPTRARALRLITCGGKFDRSTGHYDDNVVVFAELRRIIPGPLRVGDR